MGFVPHNDHSSPDEDDDFGVRIWSCAKGVDVGSRCIPFSSSDRAVERQQKMIITRGPCGITIIVGHFRGLADD